MYTMPPHTPISMLAEHLFRMLKINGCLFEGCRRSKIRPNIEIGCAGAWVHGFQGVWRMDFVNCFIFHNMVAKWAPKWFSKLGAQIRSQRKWLQMRKAGEQPSEIAPLGPSAGLSSIVIQHELCPTSGCISCANSLCWVVRFIFAVPSPFSSYSSWFQKGVFMSPSALTSWSCDILSGDPILSTQRLEFLPSISHTTEASIYPSLRT